MHADTVAIRSDKEIALRTEDSRRIDRNESQGVRWTSPINGKRISSIANELNIAIGGGTVISFLVLINCSKSVAAKDRLAGF